jgi:methyl-accepting chemotaxis protein
MRRILAPAIVGVALLALSVWGCFGVVHHVIVAIDKWGDAGESLNRTLAKVNGKAGTIAMLDEDIGAAKSMIIHADLVARHEQQQFDVWDRRGAQLFQSIDGGITDLRKTIRQSGDAAGSFGKTADAATHLVDDLRKEAADKDHGVGATMANVNGAVSEARSLSPDVKRIAHATAGTMEHVEGTSASLEKISEHVEKKVDSPPTWKDRATGAGMSAAKLFIWWITR